MVELIKNTSNSILRKKIITGGFSLIQSHKCPGPSATVGTQDEKSKQPTSQVAALSLGLPNANAHWCNSSFTEEPGMDNDENEGTGTLIDDAEIVCIS